MHTYYLTGDVFPSPFYTSGNWKEFWCDLYKLTSEKTPFGYITTKKPLPKHKKLYLLHYHAVDIFGNNLVLEESDLAKPKSEIKSYRFTLSVYINRSCFE